MESSWKAGSDLLLLRLMIGRGEACRLIWNAGQIVLGLRFSLIRCLLLRSVDWLSGRIKDAYSPKQLVAGKVHIFHRSTSWHCRFGLGVLV